MRHNVPFRFSFITYRNSNQWVVPAPDGTTHWLLLLYVINENLNGTLCLKNYFHENACEKKTLQRNRVFCFTSSWCDYYIFFVLSPVFKPNTIPMATFFYLIMVHFMQRPILVLNLFGKISNQWVYWIHMVFNPFINVIFISYVLPDECVKEVLD